jgi:hypothetical protein
VIRADNAKNRGALPNLIVIGAMKSGTSSLHYYLGRHPEVQMSQPKELHFFVDASCFDPDRYLLAKGETAPLRGDGNWHRGVDWYKRHFDPDSSVRGESTVAYSFPWYPGTPQRMAQVLPEARLLFIVRNPIERMISHYHAYQQAGREHRDIDEVLRAPNSQYLAASRYRTILDGFIGEFERKQLMVVRQDHLMVRRRDTLKSIFGFLGVEPSYWSEEMNVIRNQFESKGWALRAAERFARAPFARPVAQRIPAAVKARVESALTTSRPESERAILTDATRSWLLGHLEPEIRGIEELTGWNLDSWRRLHAHTERVGVSPAQHPTAPGP